MNLPLQTRKQPCLVFLSKATLVAVLLLITGCATDNNKLQVGTVDWFNKPGGSSPAIVTLARDPGVLKEDGGIQTALQNVVELANQKRFVEARHILAEVRELQDPEKDGYQAVTCAMALLALREGSIRTFKRIAHQLDAALGEPVKVAPSYVEVISLYRLLSQNSLPVNAPEGMKRLKEQHFPTEKAKL